MRIQVISLTLRIASLSTSDFTLLMTLVIVFAIHNLMRTHVIRLALRVCSLDTKIFSRLLIIRVSLFLLLNYSFSQVKSLAFFYFRETEVVGSLMSI